MKEPTFSNYIRELRTERGIRQEDLAAKVGITRQTVIALEQNQYLPSLELAYKLARAFDVRVEEVFQYSLLNEQVTSKGGKMSTMQKAPALKQGEIEYFRSKTKGFCDLEGPGKPIKEGYHIPKPVMEAAVKKGFDNKGHLGGSLIEVEQEDGQIEKVINYAICKDCYESLRPFLD